MKRTTITFLVALCALCGLLSWRTVASRAAMPGPEQPRIAGQQVAGASGVTHSANRMSSAAASAACVVPNSITNPGFETGDLTGWNINDDRIFVDNATPHSGTYSAKAGPIGRTGLLSQNFSAIPGQQYQVSFWVRNDSGTGPNSYIFFINGSVLERVNNAPAFGYTLFTYTVTAVATFSQVMFIFRNDTGYFHVDDVNVRLICSCDPVVTMKADSGAGSLREAIFTACPGSTITFQPGLTGTITLASELPIPKDLTIVGPGANRLTVSGNNAVRVFNITAENSVTISGLTIANGRASTLPLFPGFATGGGISNGAGTLNLTGCTIADNTVSVTGGGQTSSSNGGGIASAGTLNMTACTISGNSAVSSGGSFFNFGQGGGVYTSGELNLTACTIYGNSASASGGMGTFGDGGGIWANGMTTLTACTIYGNSATGSGGNTSNQGSGGGIAHTLATTTVTVGNTIIAGNTAETGPDSYIATVISQGYNLIGKNDGGLGFDAGNPNANQDIVGTSASPINPRLGPLANNGGPTKTMALLADSPAMDKGKSFGLSTDQRGQTRPVDNQAIPAATGGDDSDIGAIEMPCSQGCNAAPVAVCRNITVTIVAGCGVSITAAQINNGSFDPDADDSISLSLNNSGPFGPGVHSVTLMATDSHGASASCTSMVTVVDNTIPTLTCPSNITVYLPPNTMNTAMTVNYPNPTANDNCPVNITTSKPSGSVFPVGTTTVNVTARDAGGNQATCSFTVTVLYNFRGFLWPMKELPEVNMANMGSDIPVKFSLSGNKGVMIFAAGFPVSQPMACSGGKPAEIEETVTAGASSLSYDAATDTYTYVWKTEKSWKGTCRQLNVKLNDGTSHFVNFQFK